MLEEKSGQWALGELERLHKVKGGLVDCHRHLDRQNTLDEENYKLIANDATLQQKWEYIDRTKRSQGYLNGLKLRMTTAVEDMMNQGIRACRTFIDVDTTVGLSGIKTAIAVKKWAQNFNFNLQIAAYPIRGVDSEEERALFEKGAEMTDAIGTLPSRGRKNVWDWRTNMKNMKYFFGVAKRLKKPIDLQIDQANHPAEQESYMLLNVTREFRDLGYEQSVTAVHCISLGAQRVDQIIKITKGFREQNINVIVCPGAALSMLMNYNIKGPIRNSIAPVMAFLGEGVVVALGTDNVSDIFMPFTNGDIREEIRELARAIRWQDNLSELADIATINGRKVLGLPTGGLGS